MHQAPRGLHHQGHDGGPGRRVSPEMHQVAHAVKALALMGIT